MHGRAHLGQLTLVSGLPFIRKEPEEDAMCTFFIALLASASSLVSGLGWSCSPFDWRERQSRRNEAKLSNGIALRGAWLLFSVPSSLLGVSKAACSGRTLPKPTELMPASWPVRSLPRSVS